MPAPFRVPSPAAPAPWPWLAALAAITFLSLGSYAGIQQVLRSSANDPQAQLAEDAAARLAAGAAPRDVVPAEPADIAASLAPWVAVVQADTGALATSGVLDGRAPSPPQGVLAAAARSGEDRVTWMPARHLRIALVAVAVPGRPGLVVISGRALRETEERVGRIGRIFQLTWAAAIGAVLAAWALTALGRRERAA